MKFANWIKIGSASLEMIATHASVFVAEVDGFYYMTVGVHKVENDRPFTIGERHQINKDLYYALLESNV